MKKLNVFLGLSVLSMALFITACTDEDAIAPSLQITSGEFDTVPANSTVTITWRADAGDAKLTSFTIKEGNTPIVDEDNIDWNAFEIPSSGNDTYQGSATVSIEDEDITFTLIVTDKDGLTDKKDVKITIEEPVGDPISSFTAVLMGGQGNLDIGSYLDANTGTVYKKTPAITNSSIIDIVYYYGGDNLATLCAPSDVTVNGGGDNLTLCSDFSVKNATLFGTSSVTSAEFDAMTDDLEIAAITGLNLTKLITLGEGNVLAFQTVQGKKGLIKVASIATGGTGTITLNVKVQE